MLGRCDVGAEWVGGAYSWSRGKARGGPNIPNREYKIHNPPTDLCPHCSQVCYKSKQISCPSMTNFFEPFVPPNDFYSILYVIANGMCCPHFGP